MAQARIEVLRAFSDPRGLLFEPVDGGQLAGQQNTHLVLTEPGCVRGNHYHLVGTEITCVVGPAFVRLREDGVLRDLDVPAGEVWRLTIPPGVVHAYRNPGPGTMVLIAFNTEPHDPEHGDAVREIVL